MRLLLFGKSKEGEEEAFKLRRFHPRRQDGATVLAGMQDGLVPLLRLVATALCFSAVGADSPPTDGPALHQPELIDPIHQLPAADDLVEVHRGEGGRGLLATIGASPTDAAEDAISDAGIPALMDASHQSAAREGSAAAAAATAAAAA